MLWKYKIELLFENIYIVCIFTITQLVMEGLLKHCRPNILRDNYCLQSSLNCATANTNTIFSERNSPT